MFLQRGKSANSGGFSKCFFGGAAGAKEKIEEQSCELCCFPMKRLNLAMRYYLTMIDKIQLNNFKSYANAELKLAPLTVLIGANASGKSNALEALRFLNMIGIKPHIKEVQYEIDTQNNFIRGTTQSLFKHGTKEFSISSTFKETPSSRLELSFNIDKENALKLTHESFGLVENENYLYRAYPAEEGKTEIAITQTDGSFRKDEISLHVPVVHFINIMKDIKPDKKSEKSLSAIRTTQNSLNSLKNITFLDPKPRSMRAYVYLTKNQLRDDGENLSAVLYYLWNEGAEEDKKTLLTFISSLPEQDITGFDFLRGPRNEVMLQVIETFGGKEKKVDATLLSDGTLRILAFAVALLTAPEGSLVIIEEIDNGLHPSRAGRLLETLRNVATERNLSVLLSSHNPALLDALPNPAVPDVVFCYRNPKSGDSELIRMSDIENYPELILQGSLGDLLTEGLIDRFVKNRSSKKERVKQGKAWLESVK